MKYIVIVLLLLVAGLPAEAQQLAFPGAVGFGRFAVGGRGGTVYEVTTLADGVPAPPGSLRACIEASGPRTCVFRVAGTITTAGTNLTVTNPNITIAGQTAPFPGIQVRTGCSLGSAALTVNASQVIIRFMRFFADQRRCLAPSSSRDALALINLTGTPTGLTDIILDHVSTRFGADENIGASGPCNFTLQWSNMAWGLEFTRHPSATDTPCAGETAPPYCDTGHSKGIRLTMSGAPPWTGWENCGATLAYNMIAHVNDRAPQVDRQSLSQVVNNLGFNVDSTFGEYRAESGQVLKMNQIGNVGRQGPETQDDKPLIDLRALDSLTPNTPGDLGTFQLYMSDNISTGSPPIGGILGVGDEVYLVGTPHDFPPVPAYPASSVLTLVPARAGASLFQDSADRLLAWDVLFQKGSKIDAPAEAQIDVYTVGKMADELRAMPTDRKHAQPDKDRDGMPDWWEAQFGLDPLDSADNAELAQNGSGYTNLEEYLNFLAAPAFPPPP